MFENLVDSIQYGQALEFLGTIDELLDLEIFQSSGKQGMNKIQVAEQKVSACFLTYAVNPLKIIVMLINSISLIQDRFPMLSFKTQGLK